MLFENVINVKESVYETGLAKAEYPKINKSNTVYLQVTLIISIIYLSYIVMQYCTFTNNIVYI